MSDDRALFNGVAHLCHGHPADEVLSVCANVIMNCIRQNYGLRREAQDKFQELYGRAADALMEHYDPNTGRRRSVVPFDQVISPNVAEFGPVFPSLGGKNGRT